MHQEKVGRDAREWDRLPGWHFRDGKADSASSRLKLPPSIYYRSAVNLQYWNQIISSQRYRDTICRYPSLDMVILPAALFGLQKSTNL